MSDTEAGLTADQGDNVSEDSQADADAAPKRVRSSIAFPYDDLTTVLKLVEIAHNTYGGRCTADQLAAALQMKAKSGSFRLKVSAGRTFGVLGGTGSDISTTPLGVRALSAEDTGSRAEAFLTVPLYHALYDTYQGVDLPGDAGLEAKILDLGVSEKQVPTARQVFLRSADQAGFFAHGRSRLVLPPEGKVGGDDGGDDDPPKDEDEDVPAAMKHPLIQGLLAALPDPGQTFPDDERELWLRTLDMNLSFIYKRTSGRRSSADEADT